MSLRLLRHEERGVAIVTALGVTAVISLLATALLTFSVASQKQGRANQDWHLALAAAESGVDDYLARLNRGGDYSLYSSTTPPPDGNGAFTGWVYDATDPSSVRFVTPSNGCGGRGKTVRSHSVSEAATDID